MEGRGRAASLAARRAARLGLTAGPMRPARPVAVTGVELSTASMRSSPWARRKAYSSASPGSAPNTHLAARTVCATAPSAAPLAPSALTCSRTPTQNWPSKKTVKRAETLGEGGELGRDEDGADDEGTADSFGCDYSHPVAAGVPRRRQWAVVPWVTNAWLSLPYGLGGTPAPAASSGLPPDRAVRATGCGAVAPWPGYRGRPPTHLPDQRTRGRGVGSQAARAPPFSRRISTVLASNKYRSHDEQVPFSRRISTVLTEGAGPWTPLGWVARVQVSVVSR